MLEILWAALLVVGVGVFLASWYRLVQRLRAGQAIVPWEPRRPIPWGLIDFLVGFGLPVVFFVISLRALAWGRAAGWIMESGGPSGGLNPSDFFAQSLASLLGMLVSVIIIWIRFRARWSDFGWIARKVWSDIRLGVGAFAILRTPTYALQVLLVQFVESKHPLLELIRQEPRVELIVGAAFSAVIVAPLFEEYLYRGLLQGWLERMASFHEDVIPLLLGGPVRSESVDTSVAMPDNADGQSPPCTERSTADPLQAAYAPPEFMAERRRGHGGRRFRCGIGRRPVSAAR